MKYVIMSDAHGNLYYLKKCLEEIHKYGEFDKKVFLGDTFGYGSNGDACFKLLREEGFFSLMGNHEAMILGDLPLDNEKNEIYRLKKSKYIKDIMLEPLYFTPKSHKKIIFVHGSPQDPLTGYLYENDIEHILEETPYEYVFMGHTHRPYIKEYKGTVYVNVGSCGLPRDIGNQPSIVMFDDETTDLKIIRISIEKEYILNNYNDVHPVVKECLLRNVQ